MTRSPVINNIIELANHKPLENGNGNGVHQKSPSPTTTTKNENVSPAKNFRLYICLTLGSLGVIFGDIGTSPLYVLKTIFAEVSSPSREQCVGAISLIIWNLIILVTIKYALFILMADNRGEGGTFALCGLLTGDKSKLRARAKHVISIVSIIAASLLIGDGALTPAISVLSAVEGIAITSEGLQMWILPITVVIILILFFVQMFGTSKIGLTFAPIMIVWFLTLFIIGIWRITFDPYILHAFNPWEAISHLIREKQRGFIQMGGVFLSVTGLEALYADLGHFGRWPVRTSWLFVVLPAVIANYLGQGALIMTNPHMISNPFYNAGPQWARWPLIILATMATVIASQAIITGVFSLLSQAASLGYAPPLRVIHTNKKVIGQIYVPAINWIVMLITLWITLHFRSSDNLAHAYGVTVCSVMVITTILYMCVMRYVWHNHWIRVTLFGLFLLIDLYFLSANVMKFFEGAWVALLVGIVFFFLGFAWYFGQSLLRRYLHCYAQTTALPQLANRLGLPNYSSEATQTEFPRSRSFEIDHQTASSDDDDDDDDNDDKRQSKPIINVLPPMNNVNNGLNESLEERQVSKENHYRTSATGNVRYTVTPGLGVFLTTSSRHTPHVFERVLAQIHACPEMAIFLKFEYARVPIVETAQRFKIRTYTSSQQHIYHITARYGYCEHKIHLMDLLNLAASEHGLPIPEERQMTFYVPALNIKVIRQGWRVLPSKWILHLYSVLKNVFPFGQKNLRYPPEHTVTVGVVVPL